MSIVRFMGQEVRKLIPPKYDRFIYDTLLVLAVVASVNLERKQETEPIVVQDNTEQLEQIAQLQRDLDACYGEQYKKLIEQ